MSHTDFRSLADVERDHILETLSRCNGNRTLAAKLLHISLRGLRLKLHDYARCGNVVPPPAQQSPGCASQV
jgi:DNA-binding NtrC family response regulator